MADDKKDERHDGSLMRRLLKARTILISEVVTDKLAKNVQAQAFIMNDDDANKPITVYINSPGGSADSGFAIYDTLRFVKPPIRTIVAGLCASAAVVIYLAAPKERRFATPNSRFLLHQPSTRVLGSASDLAIGAEEIVKLRERYNAIVAAETGKTLEGVTKDADRDFWLSPEQAKQYGLVGKVAKSLSEIA